MTSESMEFVARIRFAGKEISQNVDSLNCMNLFATVMFMVREHYFDAEG